MEDELSLGLENRMKEVRRAAWVCLATALCIPCLPGLGAIWRLVVGIKGLRQCRRCPDVDPEVRGLALSAVIVGAAGLAIGFLVTVDRALRRLARH